MKDKASKEGDYRVEWVDEYHTLGDPEDTANPLIAVFAPFTYGTINTLMANGVAYSAQARLHGADDRIGYVMNLSSFFFPVPEQVEFMQRLWALMLQGYRKRNPLRSGRAHFSSIMKAINEGTLELTQDRLALNSMSAGVLIGTPGTGKTTSVEMFFRHFDRLVLQHRAHPELFQVLCIKVEAPKGGSAKSLARRIYTQLRAAAEALPVPVPFRARGILRTEDEFKEASVPLARKLNLGLLVLDELQHMFKSGGKEDDDAMKFLTEFVNDLRIPVLMIGTWQCDGHLSTELRLGRRGTGPADGKFHRMPCDKVWELFLDTLFANDYLRTSVTWTPEMRERFYHHTQGIQDFAVKLFQCCQIEAILEADTPDQEQITEALIDRVFEKHFTRVATALRILREGRSESDPQLWDLEPEDMSTYLKVFAANARTQKARGRKAEGMLMSSHAVDQRVGAVAASLTATGSVAEGDAEVLAQASVDQAPHKPAIDHVQRILADTKPKSPRPKPTASAKRRAEIDAEIRAYDDCDVRKVVYLSSQDNSDVELRLAEQGLWTSLAAEPL